MSKSELPPLMGQLFGILTLEKTSRFLPIDVASIVIKLIELRKGIFTSAA